MKLPQTEPASTNPDRMVILLNSSANMSRGKYAAQAVHAALNAEGVTHGAVIVLGASPSEVAKLSTTVRDAGHTEVEPGTLTAGTDWVPVVSD